jgi:hypothetical protein
MSTTATLARSTPPKSHRRPQLFAPSTSATAERAYVELSRGRLSNRIYATDDRAWIDAIAQRHGHALAVDQKPETRRTLKRVIRLRQPLASIATVNRHSRSVCSSCRPP